LIKIGVDTMATYKQIQEYIKEKYNCTVKTCWISDIKEQCGLNPRIAYNRYDDVIRLHPCPERHKKKIMDTFRYFGLVE